MTLLQHHILAEFLTFLATFLLGSFVLLRNPKRSLNRVFFLYSLSIAGWSIAESFSLLAPDSETALSRFFYEIVPVSFIGTLFLHFNYLLSGKPLNKLKKRLLQGAYCVSLFFSILGTFAPLLLLNGVSSSHYLPHLSNPGPLYPAWTVSFFLITIFGNIELVSLYMKSQGEQRNRLKYFVWSTVVGYIGGSPDWLLGYRLYVPGLNPFGIYAVLVYTVVTAYAILQHKLFDINLVIRKSLIYSLLVTALTVGYFGLVYGVERLFQVTIGYSSPWISLTAFALMALAFQPLKIGIQRLVDWLIFRVPQEELVKRMERFEEEARQSEKMKAVATLAAGLCHELRNPLQAIQTHAEVLPERYDDPKFRESCSQVMKIEIARVNDLLRQLMDFARPKRPALCALEPHKILDSTLDFLSNEFVKRQVHLEKKYGANGTQIQADSDQLRQVIVNLVLNALQAIGKKGRVTVTTGQENGWFTLEVADTGPGIDPKILPKLFEPFITTKPGGTGLGLSIVHTIVREHRGKISVQSQPGQGATFTLHFPVA